MSSYLKTLLPAPEGYGYPDEYILSRIMGRRCRLIDDWRPAVYGTKPGEATVPMSEGSADFGAKELRREYEWLFHQMNESLREVFRPFLFYAELRTLFACLRHLRSEHRKAGILEETLSHSLLSEKIREMLVNAEDFSVALSGTEAFLVRLSGVFRGVAGSAERDGMRSFETETAKRYLVYALGSLLHGALAGFFRRVVDSRNIITLYKHISLQKKNHPEFIDGGTLKARKLRQAAEQKSIASVEALLRVLGAEPKDPLRIETLLYSSMSVFLKKQSAQFPGSGLILYYLWSCSVQATNLAILAHGRDLDRDTVLAELVS